MSTNVRQFLKLSSRQQNKNFKQLLMESLEKNAQSTVKRSLLSGPSIIRIVPSSSKKILPIKRKPKCLVNKAKRFEVVPSTSTVRVQRAPHEQDHRYQSEEVPEYADYEVITDNDVPYVEADDVDTKQVLISVQKPSENCFKTIPENVNKVHSSQCCNSCRETLDTILRQQQEILKYLKKQEQGVLPMDRVLDLLPPMPFDDLNDFLDFDESLASNENVQDQFLIKLKRLLVSNEQKSISNIMSSILTNELCRKVSWTGIKNSIMFGSSNMVSLIIDLVQQYHDLDIDVIKSRIADWLRRCGDRIANENRKNKKKLETDVQI